MERHEAGLASASSGKSARGEGGTSYVGIFETRVVPCPNGNSTARDHLANERSYLAGLRTSLVVIGFGFGITEVSETALFMGTLFICMGAFLLLLAGHRYQSISYHLQKEEFIIDNLTASVTVIITLILALVLLVFVFVSATQRGVL